MNTPGQNDAPQGRIPRGVWVLGFVSLLMDISSEMVHSLLPLFMVTTLGVSALTVGLIEGLAESTALMVKVFSGVLSDYLGKRKGLALFGYALGALTKPLFAIAPGAGLVLTARLLDRVGKGVRGAPRDALVADITPAHLRGAAFGLRQSLDTVGALLGPLLAVGLMLLWADDFRAVFWVAVIPGAMAVALLAFGLREPARMVAAGHREQTIAQAVMEAFRYPSFGLLMAGYFVCGFQVVFIGVHMPSYLRDKGLSPEVASYALALIGLFNVFGTYVAGSLGQKLAKRKILAAIYFGRAITISLFLLVPISPLSVYVFASVIGFLWLSTVPVTNALVAQIFGVAHLSMLSGFVFLGHQVGSFLGVWLGGFLYDRTGSYDVVWYIAIALGVFAAFINLPVKESAIARPMPQMA